MSIFDNIIACQDPYLEDKYSSTARENQALADAYKPGDFAVYPADKFCANGCRTKRLVWFPEINKKTNICPRCAARNARAGLGTLK